MIARNFIIAFESLWRAKSRTMLSVLAVALTVGTVVFELLSSISLETTLTSLPDSLFTEIPASTILLAGAAILMGAIVAMSLGVASVMERRKEIIIRRIYGATRKHIFIHMVLEMAIVVAIGGLLGIAGVAGGATVWNTPGSGILEPLYLALALVVLMIAAIVTGIPPALQAIKYHPTD